MYSSARPATVSTNSSLSSTFVGSRVQIDEQWWSSAFSAQLSAWACVVPTLVVLEGGQAAVSDFRSRMPFGEQVYDQWAGAHRHAASSKGGTHSLGACVVFRFEPGTVASELSFAPGLETQATNGTPRSAGVLVQVGPRALFQYYWRRHALSLRYPSPEAHVEDDAMALLRHVLSHAWPCGRSSQQANSPPHSRHQALAAAAQAIMTRTISSPHPIAEIARSLDTSPFHLAHVFRTEVGVSVHQYLLQLRLVTALARLREGEPDLSKLALELGFSHHSHFSSLFHRAIGYSPRDVRRMLTASSIADLGIARALNS